MVAYASPPRSQLGDDVPKTRGRRATKLAHGRGGVTKAANAPLSPSPAPCSATILELPRGKHPSGDQAAIAAYKSAIFGNVQISPVALKGTIMKVMSPSVRRMYGWQLRTRACGNHGIYLVCAPAFFRPR